MQSGKAARRKANQQQTAQRKANQGRGSQSALGSQSKTAPGKAIEGRSAHGSKSTARQGAKSTARQGSKSSAAQGAKSTARQGSESTARQGAKSSARQGSQNTAAHGSQNKAITRDHRVRPGEDARLDKLVRELTGLPNTGVRGLIDQGGVSLGGKPALDGALMVREGQRLRVVYEPGHRYRPSAKPKANRGFRLIYEDEYLLVVDKQPGVLTEPNKGEKDTLVDYLGQYLGRGKTRPGKVWVVHRLDRDTSGALVMARHPRVAAALKAQFEAKKPEREYVAIVSGRLPKDQGSFRGLLATDADLNQVSTMDASKGKPAVTHYKVAARYAPTSPTASGATEVRVKLETGRRNQIRVHFSEAGHPVLGDTRYNPRQAKHPLWKLRRLALHALVLGFTHPETGKAMRFEAPLPAVFQHFREQADLPRGSGKKKDATG